MFRQGDVLIVKVSDGVIPSDAKKQDHCIVALGEATGHTHQIYEGAEQWVASNGTQYVKVTADTADLKHQEHGTIPLDKGIYRIVHQREYTPRGLRDVQD